MDICGFLWYETQAASAKLTGWHNVASEVNDGDHNLEPTVFGATMMMIMMLGYRVGKEPHRHRSAGLRTQFKKFEPGLAQHCLHRKTDAQGSVISNPGLLSADRSSR